MVEKLAKIISQHYVMCTPSVAMSRTSLWRCSTDVINSKCRNIGITKESFCVGDNFNNIMGWIRVSVVRPDTIREGWKTMSNTGNYYALLHEENGEYLLYQARVNTDSNAAINDITMPLVDWLDDLEHHLFHVSVKQQIAEDDYGFEEKD